MRNLYKNKRVIIAGDGESKNQSIHVKDVNTALLASAEISSLPKHDIFNISGKEVLSINEFMELSKSVSASTSKVTHLPLFLVKGMVHIVWRLHKTKVHPSYLRLIAQDQYFDISKAKHILGWAPKYTVKEALKDTIEFLREEHL